MAAVGPTSHLPRFRDDNDVLDNVFDNEEDMDDGEEIQHQLSTIQYRYNTIHLTSSHHNIFAELSMINRSSRQPSFHT